MRQSTIGVSLAPGLWFGENRSLTPAPIILSFTDRPTTLDQLNSRKATDHKAIIDRIMECVKDRYADAALTIESFEDLFNLSGIHLTRLFKRFTRQSFADYLRAVRLEKAKHLISTMNEPMQLIAEQVGFTNATYFYTLFKKEYGMTPAEYRQSQAESKRTRQHTDQAMDDGNPS